MKKFMIVFILSALIPTIIVTTTYIINFNEEHVKTVKENIISVAQDNSRKLENFFEDNLVDMKLIINKQSSKQLINNSNNNVDDNEDDKKNLNLINETLKSRREEDDSLDGIIIIDKERKIVSSSEESEIGRKAIIDEKYLNKLYNNENVISDIILSDEDNNEKYIITAIPCYDTEYRGAILTLININYFNNLVNKINFFETGKIIIMDSKGNIAATESENVKDNINNIDKKNTLLEKWNNINFKEQPKGIIEYNIDNVKKIAYYSEIANTNWKIFSTIEEKEFTVPFIKKIETLVFFTLIFFIMVISIYIFIFHYFSKPIYKLLKVIKDIKKGNYNNRFKYNKNNEFGEIAKAFNELIDTVSIQKKQVELTNKKFESLICNVPGGVNICTIKNDDFILDFISAGHLSILGYSEEEIKLKFNDRLLNLIYIKDREKVKSDFEKQLKNSDKFSTECRMITKDKKIIWIFIAGQIIKELNNPTKMYSLFIDISDRKAIEEELRISEETYRIIMNQTEDIIFRWNVENNNLIYSENWNKKFKYNPITVNFREVLYSTDIIHKDDIDIVKNIFKENINENNFRQIELRVKTEDNKYIWCRIRLSKILDQNGNLLKVVGVIIDIDKEKKETQKLVLKSQIDSLTCLYNKGTVENIIEEYINNTGKDNNHALFAIDVDNFKTINDNLGHLYGDKVLSNISSNILKIFGEKDIIGRIGGDEFVVLLKNIKSEQDIIDKAEKLAIAFRENKVLKDSRYKVSASIGISEYPKHGKSFKKLFQCADQALYLAKNKGKDNYHKLD